MDNQLYEKLGKYHYNCETCPTRCDGKSKEQYLFENDSRLSEKYEQALIRHINRHNRYFAQKSTTSGYPDLELYHPNNPDTGAVTGFIEVKVQQRTFMSVRSSLPNGDLYASETVALNLSDLLRYFEVKNTTNLPLYIVWALLNRPCVLGKSNFRLFYQEIDVLQVIYDKYLNKRRFRRKSGLGDIVDGEHKGVVVNYHFSLAELIPGLPFDLPEAG